MIRSRKILKHAKGQNCQLALPGFCSQDPETTVFAHLNGSAFGKGSGIKAHDFAGFFACHKCHMAYDLHEYTIGADEILRAVIGTWLILIEDGVIVVPREIEAPPLSKPIKPRKPKDERKAVQSSPFPKPKHKYSAARGRVVER